MTVAFWIYLFFLLIQDKGIKHHYSESAALGKEGSSECKVAFPFTRQGLPCVGIARPSSHLASAAKAPLKGSRSTTPYSGRNGDYESYTVEMWELQAHGQGQHAVLPGMWTMVGGLHGQSIPSPTFRCLEAYDLPRPGPCGSYMGQLDRLGTHAFAEPPSSSTTATLQATARFQGEGRWQESSQRQASDPEQGIHGPREHGTLTATTHSALPEHDGHNVDAGTSAVQ